MYSDRHNSGYRVSDWRGPRTLAERPIKSAPMVIDGRVMNESSFITYVERLKILDPQPTRVFLHHTWKPTRESWKGKSTIAAMKKYYEKQLWRDVDGTLREGWTAGPHIFVADDGIWLFSDLRLDGVGVRGHNTGTRHVEMVGNYDEQLPSGATLDNTIAVLGMLHVKFGLDIANLGFHRDLGSKSCPGRAVQKEWIIPQVAQWIDGYRRSKTPAAPNDPAAQVRQMREALLWMIKRRLIPARPESPLSKEAARRRLLGPITAEMQLNIAGQAYVAQVFSEGLLMRADGSGKILSVAEMEKLLLNQERKA
ncbi:MAG: peptidoglycan recognition family protein [Anaerolineae bacterium]|jgi:hypothetical protein